MWAVMEKLNYNKMNFYFWFSITIFKQNVSQKFSNGYSLSLGFKEQYGSGHWYHDNKHDSVDFTLH